MLGCGTRALTRFRRHIDTEKCPQQLDIGGSRSSEVGQFRTLAYDTASEFCQAFVQTIERRADTLCGAAEGVGIDQQSPEAVKSVMSWRRQCELVPDPLGSLVGSRQDVQLDSEIGRAAGHRADNSEIATHRYRWRIRRTRAPQGNEIETGFVGENAAIMRRSPQRAADVGAEFYGDNPAASAAAAPPDDPPGVRARSHGLLVVP